MQKYKIQLTWKIQTEHFSSFLKMSKIKTDTKREAFGGICSQTSRFGNNLKPA